MAVLLAAGELWSNAPLEAAQAQAIATFATLILNGTPDMAVLTSTTTEYGFDELSSIAANFSAAG